MVVGGFGWSVMVAGSRKADAVAAGAVCLYGALLSRLAIARRSDALTTVGAGAR